MSRLTDHTNKLVALGRVEDCLVAAYGFVPDDPKDVLDNKEMAYIKAEVAKVLQRVRWLYGTVEKRGPECSH